MPIQSASAAMDPFQGVPPEIRQSILCQTETRQDLINLSHASPAMFGQRVDQLSRTIQVHLRKMLFCNDRLQDAMAIIVFPKRASHEEAGEGGHRDRIHHHLEQWAARDLPDPIRTYDVRIMDKFESLCLRLDCCIKDFLWKATSSHLRQAYIHLPEWSHPSFHNNVGSLPPRPEHKVDLDSLSPGEKQRIIKAFLRYEILAQLFRSRPHCYRVRHTGNQINSTPAWDWDMLDRYEGNSSELWEIEGLQCVFEYFRTVYGAISARFDGVPTGLANISAGWRSMLPSRCRFGGVERILSSSDNMNVGFKASYFIKKRTEPIKVTWVGKISTNRLLDILALGGVDQATQLLMAGRDYSEGFFDSAAGRDVQRERVWGLRGLGPLAHVTTCTEASNWKETAKFGPGVWSRRNPRELYNRCNNWDRRGLDALLCAYRQRAWAFLDDERCYPETCRFYTLQEVDWMMGADLDLGPEPRAEPEPQRRSQESRQQIKEACENPDMWLLGPTAAYQRAKES